MGLDDRPVDSLPQERVVGKAVGVVPAEFAGDEVGDATAVEDLGKVSVVAERVGKKVGVPR
jgi:hypothetical protein